MSIWKNLGLGGVPMRMLRGGLACVFLWIASVGRSAPAAEEVRHFAGDGRSFPVVDLVPKQTPASIRGLLEKSGATATINVRWTSDDQAVLEGWRGDRWFAADAKLEAKPRLVPLAPGVVVLTVDSEIAGDLGNSLRGGGWSMVVGLLERSKPGVVSPIPEPPPATLQAASAPQP